MTRRIASLFATIVATVALLSACGAASPIITAEPYSPSDGVRVDFSNDVSMENFFFLTAEAGAPIRPMGSIVNRSDSNADLVFEVEGHSASFDVPANSVVNLETEAAIITGIELTPGTNVPVTITSGGPITHDIPVLDGTIPPYDQYLP